MAKVIGPLLSFAARGQIGQAQVYSSWRGIPYGRRYVIPANPRTGDQTQTRTVFRWATAVWLYMPAIGQEPWEAYSQGQALTGRNAWVGRQVAQMRTDTTLANMEGSPGVRGGLPAASWSITGGTGTISATPTLPTAPTGWTLLAAQAIALRDQDPHGDLVQPVRAEQATNSPWTISFSSLAADDYAVSAWLKWDRGAGAIAYSISYSTIVSVS